MPLYFKPYAHALVTNVGATTPVTPHAIPHTAARTAGTQRRTSATTPQSAGSPSAVGVKRRLDLDGLATAAGAGGDAGPSTAGGSPGAGTRPPRRQRDAPSTSQRQRHRRHSRPRPPPNGVIVSEYLHRLICWLFHGPPPDKNMVACHLCHDPLCVNPVHIMYATMHQNQNMLHFPALSPALESPLRTNSFCFMHGLWKSASCVGTHETLHPLYYRALLNEASREVFLSDYSNSIPNSLFPCARKVGLMPAQDFFDRHIGLCRGSPSVIVNNV